MHTRFDIEAALWAGGLGLVSARKIRAISANPGRSDLHPVV